MIKIFKIKTIEKDSKNKPISLKVIVGQKAKIIDMDLLKGSQNLSLLHLKKEWISSCHC